MPLFHSAGLCLFFYNSVYWNSTTVLGFPDQAVTADLTRECLIHAKVQGAVLAPSILEDMCADSSSVAALSQLKAVLFGGGMSTPLYTSCLRSLLPTGHLAKDVGDKLIQQNGMFSRALLHYITCLSPSTMQVFNMPSSLFSVRDLSYFSKCG